MYTSYTSNVERLAHSRIRVSHSVLYTFTLQRAPSTTRQHNNHWAAPHEFGVSVFVCMLGHCTRTTSSARRRRFMGHASFCSSSCTCAPRCLLKTLAQKMRKRWLGQRPLPPPHAAANYALLPAANLRASVWCVRDYTTLSTFFLATDKWSHASRSRGASHDIKQPRQRQSTYYTSHTCGLLSSPPPPPAFFPTLQHSTLK